MHELLVQERVRLKLCVFKKIDAFASYKLEKQLNVEFISVGNLLNVIQEILASYHLFELMLKHIFCEISFQAMFVKLISFRVK